LLLALRALGDPESTKMLVEDVPEPQSLGRIEHPLNPKSWVGPGLE